MRKLINFVSILFFVLIGAITIYYGFLKNRLYVVVGLALLLLIVIVRTILLAIQVKRQKKQYKALREVKIESAQDTNEYQDMVSKTVALVHVDKVDEHKIIITIYKKPILITDVYSEVNK